MKTPACAKKFLPFVRDENGSTTIEIVLWTPIVLGFLGLITDATVAMNAQQDFYGIARDASRMVATGQRTADEAVGYIQERLGNADDLVADVSIADNFVTSSITAPAGSYTTVSSAFVGGDLNAEVTMWIENFEGS